MSENLNILRLKGNLYFVVLCYTPFLKVNINITNSQSYVFKLSTMYFTIYGT